MSNNRGNQTYTQPTVSVRSARSRRLTRKQQMASIASGVYDGRNLPPVHVTDRDYRRLRSLPRAARSSVTKAILRFLAHELDRALIYPPAEIPPDAVTLRTRVIFRADAGKRPECRALVYNRAHSAIGGIIPVLTPLGVALLGLRVGSRMRYLGLDGRLKTVSIESIVYQPEAQERHLRPPYRYWPSPYADRALRKGAATATRLDRGSPLRPPRCRGSRHERSPAALALSAKLTQPSLSH